MSLRLAFGSCSCKGRLSDPVDIEVCRLLTERLDQWRGNLPGGLTAVPRDHDTEATIGRHRVSFGTYRRDVEHGGTLIVESALIHTWRRPTFIALGAVGRIYAEGLLVAGGEVSDAPDELMWYYR